MRTTPDDLLALVHRAADAVREALSRTTEWGPSGGRPDQYRSDVVADEAARGVLDGAGVGVLSEEGEFDRPPGTSVVVVVDPLDGSTNAHRGVPWFATSLCAVDEAGPAAAVVTDLSRDITFEAVRGGGARRNGEVIRPSGCRRLGDAVVGLSGLPAHHLGWWQFRALGAVALDLCAVAAGMLDGYVDCSTNAHAPWDYLGAVLVCREAGAVVADAFGRDLVVVDPKVRRTPVAGATGDLFAALVAARRSLA